jgi:hypothetical protein
LQSSEIFAPVLGFIHEVLWSFFKSGRRYAVQPGQAIKAATRKRKQQ